MMLWTTKRKSIIALFVGVLLPLCIGTVLYIWIKPNAWCSQIICRTLRIPTQDAFNEDTIPIIGYFIKHQLCDMLFSISLTFAILLLIGNKRYGIVIGGTIVLLFETLLEIAQLGVFPGNFDVFDIIAECSATIAILISIRILKIKRRTEK